MNPSEQFEHLFSYGSLQEASVQLVIFGRTLAGTLDTLPGYRTVKIVIPDRTATAASGSEYYVSAQFTGHESDCVAGKRFAVTKQELEQADGYEAGANYHRVLVPLTSSVRCWVYVSAAPTPICP